MMKNKIKQTILIFAVAVAVLADPTTALAHGHGHGHGGGHHNTTQNTNCNNTQNTNCNTTQTTYSPCTKAGCNHTGEHRHGRKSYEGHSGKLRKSKKT